MLCCCALLLASLGPVAVRGELPAPWNSYHTTDEILSEFARMASENPNLMKWQPVRAMCMTDRR